MGLIQQGINAVRARIRGAFANDKDAQAHKLAHGTRGSVGPTGADILYGYGQGQSADFFRANQDLLTRLADYEEMDEYGELNAALDLFADDTVQPDSERNRTVWVTSDNKRVENTLNDLLWKTLRFDRDAWSLVRTLCKTGNEFEEPLIDETGVVGMQPLPVAHMRRVEGHRGDTYGFIQDFKGTVGYTREEFYELLRQRNSQTGVFARPGGAEWDDEENLDVAIPFEPWEIVHFRIGGRTRRSPYGLSILEAARPIFRQLKMLEDAALFYRLERSPERLVFYTDVGDMPPPMARAEMNRLRQEHRKRRMLGPDGKPNLKFEAIAQGENIFVPVRGEKRASEIEVLNSPSWQCLTADTVIPLLDGTSPTIKELVGRSEPFWVYSCTPEGKVVPGRGYNARITHQQAEIWEVSLDNGQVVRCTGNHPFLTRDGQWVQAQLLTPGRALMPFDRKISDPKGGAGLKGYELIYNPCKMKWDYTHHMVFDAEHGKKEDVWKSGAIIHHVNHRKSDNSPQNLTPMGRKAHAEEHRNNVCQMHTPEVQARLRLIRATPEYRAKLKWSKDDKRQSAHRERMVARMADSAQRAEKSAILTAWNQSEKRIQGMTGEKHFRWREVTVAELAQAVLDSGATKMKDLYAVGFPQQIIEKTLKAAGLKWADFASRHIPGWVPKGRAKCARAPEYKSHTDYKHSTQADSPSAGYRNHKVVAVRKTNDVEPVYDLTVDKYHCFAVMSGVYLHNSMEDIEYYLKKLFTAIKIPPAYLGREEGVVRSILSNEDVRFARTVMRIQRAVIDGLERICDLHLMALGIDPDQVEYEVRMTVPSAIFELAQMEVRNARADLMGKLRDSFPLEYLYKDIFHLTDSDIEEIFQQRGQDKVRDACWEATAQSEATKYGPPGMDPTSATGADGGGGPGGGGDGGGPPGGSSGEEDEDADPRAYLLNSRGMPMKRPSRMNAPGTPLVSRWRAKHPIPPAPFSEEELYHGGRTGARGIGKKLESLLANDRDTAHRLRELSGLLHELKAYRRR